METRLSLVSVVGDLAHDCLYLQHINKHSRRILRVHSFVSLPVRLFNNCIGTMHNVIAVITMHFNSTIYYMATIVRTF